MTSSYQYTSPQDWVTQEDPSEVLADWNATKFCLFLSHVFTQDHDTIHRQLDGLLAASESLTADAIPTLALRKELLTKLRTLNVLRLGIAFDSPKARRTTAHKKVSEQIVGLGKNIASRVVTLNGTERMRICTQVGWFSDTTSFETCRSATDYNAIRSFIRLFPHIFQTEDTAVLRSFAKDWARESEKTMITPTFSLPLRPVPMNEGYPSIDSILSSDAISEPACGRSGLPELRGRKHVAT